MKSKLFLFIYCILVIIFSGCSVSTPAQDGNDLSVIEISAENLWQEFESDRDAAKDKFDGCILAITGSVAEISESFMGQPCILLENGIDSIPDGIFCFFPSNTDLNGTELGDIITINGTCSVGIHVAGDDTPFISINDASF